MSSTAVDVLDERAVARVDLDAIAHNCAQLKQHLGNAELCAVVKANGYGHGAVAVATAALESGASWLGVVSAGEAAELRANGIDARVLVMGALTASSLEQALAVDTDIVVWRSDQVDAAIVAARETGQPARLHVKLDTGMGRLGTPDPKLALELVDRATSESGLELAGFMTHFATADEEHPGFFQRQLELFGEAATTVKQQHPHCLLHAANSAATLRGQDSHFDMARCGIAVYGMDPFLNSPDGYDLHPALSLTSYVADVKRVAGGESVGYGRTWKAEHDTDVAVLPIGYGDGYRRVLSNQSDVIIVGQRFPVVGTISMDNTTVDLGLGSGVEPGQPAILIGSDGNERVLAEELATQAGTINYEITCGISERVPRVHTRGEQVAS